MKRFLALCCSLLCISGYAELSDEKVVWGTLDNGLSYYVRQNGTPEKTAALQLVVRVGSIYEREEEKGLAHFLEHLLFRGTQHLKDGEAIKYLESIGAWYGADTNAATGFHATKYILNIPIHHEGVLEKGFFILSEFAASATLEDGAIESERGVVLNELHQRTGHADWKSFEKMFNFWVRGSVYEDHFPIGVEAVVRSVSPQIIRAFYQRWYRPDRMAVVAVGDFVPEDVVQLIEHYFGSLSEATEMLEEPSLEIPFSEKPVALVHSDPELIETKVSLVSFFEEDQAELKKEVLSRCLMRLLNHRMERWVKQEDTPFLGAGVGRDWFLYPYSRGFIEFSCFEDRWREGLQRVYQEVTRATHLGFTQGEWKVVQHQLYKEIEKALDKVPKTAHRKFVQDYVDHFLYHTLMGDTEKRLHMEREILEKITLEELNAASPPWSGLQNLAITLSTPSPQVFSEATAEILIESLSWDQDKNLAALIERELPERPFMHALQEGGILGESEEAGVVFLQLDNGVKVFLKPSSLEKNGVKIYAEAKGGYASLVPEAYASARCAVSYALSSGFGNLSGPQLADFLKEEGIVLRLGMNRNFRALTLDGPSSSQRGLFELLHAVFTQPRFESSVWNLVRSRIAASQEKQRNDPQLAFENFSLEINTQNHPLFKPITLERADRAQVEEIFKQMFGCPSEFVFIIVGDFEVQEMKMLARQYMASWPSKPVPSFSLLESPSLFPEKQLRTRFQMGASSQAKTVVSLPFNFQAALEQLGFALPIHATRVLLEQRLTRVLREEMGKTYSVSVAIRLPFSPSYEQAILEISFSSPEKEIDQMVDRIFTEIERLQTEEVPDEEIGTVQELFRNHERQRSQLNSYWICVIKAAYQTNLSITQHLDFEKRISTLTAQLIQSTAKHLFGGPHYTVLSHVPD